MRAPRLYFEDGLSGGSEFTLTHERAHYLRNVMRLRPQDSVRLFNAADGEWLAEISAIERREITLKLVEQLRAGHSAIEGPSLFFAPLKRPRMELLIEKSVELGVASLHPVMTAHTVVDRLNMSRIRARMIEASEQSERLDVPLIEDPIPLEQLPEDGLILMADEHGGGIPLLQAYDRFPEAALLIGPEGGFSLEERDLLKSRKSIQTVTLGAQILRAETASIFALSAWRAWADDEVSEA